MRYDKQSDSVIIPLAEIESCEREVTPVDPKNGWACNLPGKITIVLKGKAKEPNEHDSGENFSGDAEDGRDHDSRVGSGDWRPGDDAAAVRLIIDCATDPATGAKLFEKAHQDMLLGKSGDVIDRIATKICELSGLTDKAAEDLEKNS